MEQFMIKLSSEEIKQIVAQDLPDYQLDEDSENRRLASDASDAADSPKNEQVEASTPNLESLRIKYLREKYLGNSEQTNFAAAPENSAADASESDEVAEDVIIAVKPKTANDAFDRSARPKVAIISGSEKKIIGQQG
jgi:hypothetical protein